MEGAAVVQVCRQYAVACLVIRSITDRADGQASDSYEQFRPAASENAAARWVGKDALRELTKPEVVRQTARKVRAAKKQAAP